MADIELGLPEEVAVVVARLPRLGAAYAASHSQEVSDAMVYLEAEVRRLRDALVCILGDCDDQWEVVEVAKEALTPPGGGDGE